MMATVMPTVSSKTPAKTGDLELQVATAQDAREWDQLVTHHSEARFAHLWGFRHVLESAYGYRCVYLKIVLGTRIVGVFPSVAVNRRSPRLVSQPFAEYGGPLLIESTEKQRRAFPELLYQAAGKNDCRSIEIRGGIGAEFLASSPYCARHPLYSYAELNLVDKETLWRKSLTNKARQGVNKAVKAGLRGELRRGAAAIANPFYDLYLLSMKRLGVPPHSRRFFAELAEGLGNLLVSTWIFQSDRPVAILLGGICGQRVQICVTASHPRFWADRPNDLAHWELISWAAEEGFRWFDFGSARYHGQIQFKRKWGVRLYDYSNYLLGDPASIAHHVIPSVKEYSRSMQTMSNVWAKVMPLGLSRFVGPPIRKFRTK